MAVAPTRRRPALQLNLTPLIDVVFQLVIFFLATSHLARVESQQKVDLPEAESGRREKESPPRRLVVTVGPDERLFLGGGVISRAAFAELLRREAAERAERDVEVRIRADRAVPYRAVEPLLLECVRNGFQRVTFSVLQKTVEN
jgi:biopolymer transport protein ExbD